MLAVSHLRSHYHINTVVNVLLPEHIYVRNQVVLDWRGGIVTAVLVYGVSDGINDLAVENEVLHRRRIGLQIKIRPRFAEVQNCNLHLTVEVVYIIESGILGHTLTNTDRVPLVHPGTILL